MPAEGNPPHLLEAVTLAKDSNDGDNEETPLLASDTHARKTKDILVSNGHIPGDYSAADTSVVGNGPDGGSEKRESWFRGMSAEKRWTFFLTGFGCFTTATCFSLLAPFFPNEAALKGMSQTIVGVVFSWFELIFFLSAPIFGNFVTRIGARFMFVSGLFMAGICSILFGLLEWCPGGAVFALLCFLVRTVLALGSAAFVTSSFAIVASQFPRQVATIFGALETFSGAGWMAGPLLGGILFEAGGFSLPFFVMGGLILLCAVFAAFCLPFRSGIHQGQKSRSMFQLLASPLVTICCLSVVCGTYSFGFLDATLSTHVNQFQLRATWVGVIFMLVAALYALTSPLWGWLSDKKGIKYPFIIGGNFATGVAFLLIGPSPLLPFLHTELWLVIFSLVFMGLTVGGTIIPTITCIMQEARQLNLGDGLELFGVVSGLFNSVFHMGAFLGPTIGSAVMENFGYSWSATLTSGFMFVTGLSVLLYLAVCKCLQCNRGHVRDVEKASLVTLSSQDEARRPTSGAQSHSQL